MRLAIAIWREYPQYEVVVPDGLKVSLPLFYAIGGDD